MNSLPKEVQVNLDAYIERIKKIRWFKPSKDWKNSDAAKQVKIALKAFGVEAKVEYRGLNSAEDWDAARGAAWDAARDAARDAAWDAARDAAWDAARDAAWGAAWGAEEIIVSDLDSFYKKYPNGAFIQLIPLWEMGLYPIGVIDGKFIIYVPKH